MDYKTWDEKMADAARQQWSGLASHTGVNHPATASQKSITGHPTKRTWYPQIEASPNLVSIPEKAAPGETAPMARAAAAAPVVVSALESVWG